LNTVNLEGPQSVADAGAGAASALRSELAIIVALARGNFGKKVLLITLASEEFEQAELTARGPSGP